MVAPWSKTALRQGVLCRKSPENRKFKSVLRHSATDWKSLSIQQFIGTCFESGKDKAVKREKGWAPCFICCV